MPGHEQRAHWSGDVGAHFGWASRLLGLRLDASCSPAEYIFLVTRIPGAGNRRDLVL